MVSASISIYEYSSVAARTFPAFHWMGPGKGGEGRGGEIVVVEVGVVVVVGGGGGGCRGDDLPPASLLPPFCRSRGFC